MNPDTNPSSNPLNPVESPDERIGILLDELGLATKWKRPSILLCVYRSELIRAQAESALERDLFEMGQKVVRLQVTEARFDVPKILSKLPDRKKTVFFVAGVRWGGGGDGYNAYRALNMRREYFVDKRMRAVLWLTEAEAITLPNHAPDFWAFRHRVIEFLELPVLEQMTSLAESLDWREWKANALQEDIEARIAFRRELLDELPEGEEARPLRMETLYALAGLYWARGEYARALETLKKGLTLAEGLQDPASEGHFWVGLGRVYYALQSMPEAIAAYQKASDIDPKDGVAWSHLSLVYRDQGRSGEAIEACRRAITLDPGDARPWNNLGLVHQDQGHYEEALAAFEKASALAPNESGSWCNLANVYRDLGLFEEAIAAYRKATRLDSKDAKPWNGLGGVLQGLGRREEAIKAYLKAKRLAPKSASAYLRLGVLYGQQRNHRIAIRVLKKATRLEPQNAAAWKDLGRMYYRQERLGEAIKMYKQAVRLAPQDVVSHLNLATCYRKSKRAAKAKQALQQARALIKEEEHYYKACLEAVSGNGEAAVDLLAMALERQGVSVERVAHEPSLDFIRNEARFKALINVL